ncbi:hypothetical protein AOQ88_00050 [Candidatus Riesia sp. GBBU]|nr:hypothetical protein AOQ88_00050 [Candidatus Riesia sp. GBBU]
MCYLLNFRKKIFFKKGKNRLDKYLSEFLPEYSRTRIKNWILKNKVRINHKIINSPKKNISGSFLVEIKVKKKREKSIKAKKIPIKIIYEDKYILVINKQYGITVHPGHKNEEHTLLNSILYYYPENKKIFRGGIVHRLDKNTTGALIIAKDLNSQMKLIEDFKLRKVYKEYEAIVEKIVCSDGIVNKRILRHPIRRTKMSIHPNGKSSITFYKVLEYFLNHTRLKIIPKSGRTHQIRVHMESIGHPIVGDEVYNRFFNNKIYYSDIFRKLALHSKKIEFFHPIKKNKIILKAKLPENMLSLISFLRKNS